MNDIPSSIIPDMVPDLQHIKLGNLYVVVNTSELFLIRRAIREQIAHRGNACFYYPEWLRLVNTYLNEGYCPVCDGRTLSTDSEEIGPDIGILCPQCNLRFTMTRGYMDRSVMVVGKNKDEKLEQISEDW